MEQHPIPRQITTFEFKLIGFMTLKQFLYLVVFFPLAYLIYKLVPIPLFNILCSVLIAALGAGLAFVPIQDRPMDVWIRHFINRLRSPTQYTFHKENKPLTFINRLYFDTDPHRVIAHIESQEKLAAYLAQKKKDENTNLKQKQHIQNILRQPGTALGTKPEKNTATGKTNSYYIPQKTTVSTETLPQAQNALRQPFITGVIKNSRQIPLPGVLVYIKDQQDAPLRLLKTNPHGVFASYSPLPTGDYKVEIKDPNGGYFFDTMKVHIDSSHPEAMSFYSKEML